MRFACYFLILILATSSCNEKQTESDVPENKTFLIDSLENAFVNTMNEINNNLDLIREKQGLIRSLPSGENLSKKESILENIRLINSLIESNQKKIEDLAAQVGKIGKEKSALSRLASQAKDRIEKQELEISLLKNDLERASYKLNELNAKVEELQSDNETLKTERTILAESNDELDKELNKGYFTYGTYKELRAKNIVEKKGGFLGVGKKEVLAEIFYKNRASFTQVDIREIKTVPIHGTNPKLLTLHPATSYQINAADDKGYSSITIKDPQEFWGVSKFLIVEVK